MYTGLTVLISTYKSECVPKNELPPPQQVIFKVERQRERDGQADRQTDRQTDRQRLGLCVCLTKYPGQRQ
jgi:hypothetical protein